MANVISGLDAAWAFPNLAGLKTFKAQGGKVIAGYLSYDSSKDWTPARLRMVHNLGLGALMNFEHTANRALEGRTAGVADGEHSWNEIAALIKAVGYGPKNHLHIYASADFDAQPSQYPAVDAYLKGFAQGLLNRHANADQGVYGSYTLVVHTAKAGTSKAEWQTYAWSGGNFYTGAEYYQWSNSHNAFGGAVDYDQAIDLEHLGAWWPPNHPLNVGPTTEDDMSAADVAAINKHTDATVGALNTRLSTVERMITSSFNTMIAKFGLTMRGDPTHPDNLKALREDLEKLIAEMEQHSGGTTPA